MKVTAVLHGATALAICTAFATQGVAKELVEEERIQIESTHTETPVPAAPAAPVVIERQTQAPPVVIEKQVEKTVPVPVPQPLVIHEGQVVSMTGRIVALDGSDLVLNVNGQKVMVDTGDLRTNPVKDPNGPRLRPGDQVTVSGKVDDIDHSRVKLAARSLDVGTRVQAPQQVR